MRSVNYTHINILKTVQLLFLDSFFNYLCLKITHDNAQHQFLRKQKLPNFYMK